MKTGDGSGTLSNRRLASAAASGARHAGRSNSPHRARLILYGIKPAINGRRAAIRRVDPTQPFGYRHDT